MLLVATSTRVNLSSLTRSTFYHATLHRLRHRSSVSVSVSVSASASTSAFASSAFATASASASASASYVVSRSLPSLPRFPLFAET